MEDKTIFAARTAIAECKRAEHSLGALSAIFKDFPELGVRGHLNGETSTVAHYRGSIEKRLAALQEGEPVL